MSASKELEKQAQCPHGHLSKEVIMGQKTGDLVCNACGETFMKNEEVLSPEHRNSIVMSVHALRIAMRANQALKLVQKYEAKYIGTYDWALVDADNRIVIPVMESVVNEAVSAGAIKL